MLRQTLRRMFDVLAVLACAALFVWNYLHCPGRPGTDPLAPLGWFQGFDQGQYLRAAQALSHLDFTPATHYYPPLYPLLGALFLHVSPLDPFLPINAVCFVLHVAVSFWIATRLYGYGISSAVLALVFAVFPWPTVIQWVVPWTTSLAGGLGAVMFALFFRQSRRPVPWRLDRGADWWTLALFYLAYGALFAARPLDVFVYAPFALVFFLKTLAANGPISALARTPRGWRMIATIAICGAALPAAYLGFNRAVFGAPFSGYFANVGINGFFPAFIPAKAVSLILDSGALFVEPGQAVADHVWPIQVALPVLIVSLFVAPLIVRLIAGGILLQILIYSGYGDLLPNQMFRFLGVHYFKWTFPWMFVIATGQLVAWGLAVRRSRSARRALAAAAVLVGVTSGLSLKLTGVESFSDHRDATMNSIDIDLKNERTFSVIDIQDKSRDFISLYLGNFGLSIDGIQQSAVRGFRVLGAPWGLRLVFFQPTRGRHVRLVMDAGIARFDTGSGVSRIGSYRLSLSCRWRRCTPPDFEAAPPAVAGAAPPPGVLDVGFADEDATPFLRPGWSSAEPWGRWTNALSASMELPAPSRPISSVELLVKPFLTALAPHQRVSLTVNGCPAIDAQLDFPSAGHMEFPGDGTLALLTGQVDPTCTPAGQPVTVSIRTDRLLRPRDTAVLDDIRTLGVAVSHLTFR